MKKVKHLIATSTLLFVIVCDKTSAVVFEEKSTVLPISKEDLTGAASSFSADESTNRIPEKQLDSDSKACWHTNYAIVTPHPQWLLIDMKKETKMISVGIINRYSATASDVEMKKIKIETSDDGTTFTSFGEFDFAISNGLQNFPISSAQAYRYLKITALEIQRVGKNHIYMGEIDIFGAK